MSLIRCTSFFAAAAFLASAPHGQAPCTATPDVNLLGGGSPGVSGVPLLVTNGVPAVGLPFSVQVNNAAPSTAGLLLVSGSLAPLALPEFGATVHPSLGGIIKNIGTSPLGQSPALFPVTALPSEFCGISLYAQALVIDVTATGFVAFTDAIEIYFGALTGSTGSGPIPPAPTLDPYPGLTGAASVVLSGLAPQAETVQIEADSGTQVFPVVAGAFSATVALASNKLNQIFVHSVSALGAPSAVAAANVVQDSQSPTLFIDFPPPGIVLTTTTTDVAGRVSDLLSGFQGLSVKVNGVDAAVDVGIGTNGSFFVSGIPLLPARPTTISAVAKDSVGNSTTKQISVSYAPAQGAQMAVESGNGQDGVVNQYLVQPIVVRMKKADGRNFPGKVVTFDVTNSNGRLSIDGTGPGAISLQVTTDAAGLATAYWKLGGSAGCGNNRVAVTSKDISGTVFFCASAAPGRAAQINVGSGNGQRVETAAPAPAPLRAWVNDACNGIGGVLVTFTVLQGGGKVNGQDSVSVPTTETGHVEVAFTAGSIPGNNVIEADYPANQNDPATFVVFGVLRDPLAPTTFSGLAQDNAHQPLAGVEFTLHIGPTSFTTTSAVDGSFQFDALTNFGPAELEANGAYAHREAGTDAAMSYPSLHYSTVVVPNAANALGMPVLLPPLDPDNAVLFDNTGDVVLTVKGIAGLQMLVKAGSVTLADLSVPSVANPVSLSLNQVHHDDIPMPLPDGAAPPFSWTLQPAGTRFNPPIQITYPNMSGLPAGAGSYFLSFDHDTGKFEIVGSGTVSADGSVIVSDPGSGIDKAGWGCNCPPYSVTGKCCKPPPQSNGCGNDDPIFGIPSKDLIPDCWICIFTGGKAPFSNGTNGPCDNHDKCWGTCQNGNPFGQLNCDIGFLQDLAASCNSAFPFPSPCKTPCLIAAWIYFEAVQYSGSFFGAYQSSQDDACKCDPPGLSLRGGSTSRGSGLTPDEIFGYLGIPPPTDTDGDFMPDTFELAFGLDPNDPSDQMEDPDGEGLVNLSEMVFGADPNNPDTDGDGDTDLEDVAEVQPRPQPELNKTWTVSVNGQAVTVNNSNGFLIPNVSAADQFGPGGPGTAPDFKSDEFLRLTASGKFGGETHYAFSDYFQIAPGAPVSIDSLTFTNIAPISPEFLSLKIVPPAKNVLTQVDETTQVTATATLADGSTTDVSSHLAWSTFTTSNPQVASIDDFGVVTARGEGIAYLTVRNDGATAVTAVIVSLQDPLTKIQGFVQEADGTAVAGATVSVPLISSTATSGLDGFFELLGVPSDLGSLSVTAQATLGGDLHVGSVSGLEPVPGGITDAGIVLVSSSVYWAVDASGSWHVGSNWSTGSVPRGNDHVIIDRPAGDFTITVSQGSQSAKSVTSTERLTVSSGSLTVSSNAQVDNVLTLSGGTLTAATLQVNGPFNLSGGTLKGTLVQPGFGGIGITASGAASKLDLVQLNANLTLPNGATVTVLNGLVVNGSVLLNSSGSTTALDFSGTQVLSGSGQVVFGGTGSLNLVRPTIGQLTIASGFTIRGGHGTAGNASLPLVNLGTIDADQSGKTIILAGTNWKNQGQLKAAAGAALTFSGTWANQNTILVNGGTLNLGGTFKLSDIGVFQNNGGTVNITGTLDNVGTVLSLDGATGSWFVNGGRILGGTVNLTGGTVLKATTNCSNILEGVTINGDLDLSASSARLRIKSGLTLNGIAHFSGSSASMAFDGSQTISAGTFAFEGTTGGTRIFEAVSASGTVVTFAPGVLVHGGLATLGSSVCYGQPLSIVNQGTIQADTAGQTLTVAGPSFTNQGTVAALGGATLTVSSTNWSNAATITGSNATLTFGGNWSNPGTVTLNGGTMNFGGTFTTAGIGAFVNNAGTVNVTGTLDNTGSTLVLDGAIGSWFINGGRILGGTVNLTGGALLKATTNCSNILEGVTINGDLDLSASSARFRIKGGLALNGIAHFSGSSASMAFDGSQTISAGTFAFEGTSGGTRLFEAVGAATTLTFGPGVLVHGGLGNLSSSACYGNLLAIVNQGTITADTSGQTLTIAGSSFTNQGTVAAQSGTTLAISATSWSNAATITGSNATLSFSGNWSNPGTVTLNGGTMNFGGTFTTAGIGAFVNNAGTVNITGTLDNTGSTLVLDGAIGSWFVNGGRILGGTVNLTGGALLKATTNCSNILEGVTINGDLDLSASSARFRIKSGLTLNGIAHLSGSSASMAFDGSQTISAGTFAFEGTTGGTRLFEAVGASTTLTFGPGVLVHGGLGNLSSSACYGNLLAIVNQGTITADTSGQTLTIAGSSFTNQGAVAAQSGTTLAISATSWSNAATITGSNATLSFSGAWSNPGTVTLNGGTMNFGGTFTTAGIGAFVNNAGTVNITGTLDNTGSTLVLDGAIGSWFVNGGRILGGTVNLTGGALLKATTNCSNILEGVTINGDLDLSASSARFRIKSGLTLNGIAHFSGSSASMAFDGSQTISAGTFAFEGTTGGTRLFEAVGVATTLTFGPGVLVHGGVGNLSSSACYGNVLAIVNQGTIRADTSGQTLTIAGSNFTNQGIAEALAGSTLTISPTSWTNPGTIQTTSGTVNLGGTFVSSALGTFLNNAGTVNLTGTCNNTGSTLVLDGATGSWFVNGGRILGGTVDLTAGTILRATTNCSNILEGVTINGDLDLSASSARFRIKSGLTLNGIAHFSGSSASMAFDGSQTISAGTFAFEGTTGGTRLFEAVGVATTLTFGPGVLVHGGLGNLSSSACYGNVLAIVNQGTIRADTSGQTLTIAGSSFTNQGIAEALAGSTLTISPTSWTNPGTIQTTSGTVNLGGTFVSSALGTFLNNAGTVNLTGTCNNTGSTLVLDGATGSWFVNGGRILGGTVDLTAGTILRATTNCSNILEGVTINGDLDLSASSARFRIKSGLTLNGIAHFSGSSASMAFDGSQTISAGTFAFEGTTGGTRLFEAVSGVPTAVTFGPSVLVHGGLANLNSSICYGNPLAIVNQGTIRADTSGQTLTVAGPSFTNQGIAEALAGSTLTLSSTSWVNAGTIQTSSGTVNLGGTFVSSALGTFLNNAGTVNLTGTCNNAGLTLTLDGTTGSWNLSGGTISGGTLMLTGGAALVMAANSANRLVGVSVNGDLLFPSTNSVVRIGGGLTLNGTARLSGASSSLAFEGNQTINSGTISFEGTASGNRVLEMQAVGTLTIAPGVLVKGGRGTVGGSVFFGQAMTLANQGEIRADLSGQSITISPPSWTSPGLVAATSSGTVNVGGTLSTVGLGLIQSNGGTVNLTGTVNNAGSTLTLDGTTGSWNLSGGTINGGTLTQTGGAVLTMTANSANRLVGVSVNGDLLLPSTNSVVRIGGGLTLNGTARLSGASSSLAFEGTQTINSGTISFEGTASGNRVLEMQAVGTLTIAPGVLVQGGRGTVGGSVFFGQAMTLANQGEIRADLSGQSITISPPSWTSPGLVAATSSGTVNVGGTLSTVGLGLIQSNGGTVNLTGTVNNAGSTLTLDGTTGSWNLSGGTINGGTLTQTGGAVLTMTANSANRLVGVSVNGDLLLPSTNSVVRIGGGLTLNGTARLSGASSSLAFEGTQTINSGTISFEGTASGNRVLEMQAVGTLTIAPGVLVQGGRGTVGGSVYFGQAMTLVNQGEIRADLAGQSITISAGNWSNPGTIAAAGGNISAGGSWSSAGTITVASGNSFTASNGTYTQLAGGSTLLTGGTITAATKIDIQGGTLTGNGTLAGPVSNAGTIAPGTSAGALALTSSYTQLAAGTLAIELGGTATSAFDRLLVTGTATLGGTASFSTIGGFSPTLGESFIFLTSSALSSQFATLAGNDLGGGLLLSVGYGAQAATATVVSGP